MRSTQWTRTVVTRPEVHPRSREVTTRVGMHLQDDVVVICLHRFAIVRLGQYFTAVVLKMVHCDDAPLRDVVRH